MGDRQGLDKNWPLASAFLWVDLRACQDSNGDGMGDLPGLVSRLDHFQDVGVGALMFVGMQPSDFAYGGTMMTEFCDVDPRFGTLADFDRLVAEAHARGIAIVIGWSPFSTHPDHPFFLASRDPAHPLHAEFTGYYLWTDDLNSRLPRRWGHWEWDTARKAYHHTVWLTVDKRWCPEVNLRDPRARQENRRVLAFWLDRGVDGFWVDCGVWGGFVTEREHVEASREMTELVHRVPSTWIISEGSKSIAEAIDRDGYDSFFADQARAVPVAKTVYRKPGMGMLVEFFEGMESHGIHEALYSYYDDPRGNQVMNPFVLPRKLDFGDPLDIARARLALVIHATLPLVPLYRFPEHAGLKGEKAMEHVQTFPFLMMWDETPSYGFTSGTPWRAQNEEGYPAHAAAAAQMRDPGSFLSCFRDVMRLRRSSPALQSRAPAGASYARVPTGDERNCYAYLRTDPASGQVMLVAANLLPERAVFRLEADRSRKAARMVENCTTLRRRLGTGAEVYRLGQGQPVEVDLPPYGFLVLEALR